MAARRAISAVVAPLNPASANTDSAASRMRRSMLARLRCRTPPLPTSVVACSFIAKTPDLLLILLHIGLPPAEGKKKLDHSVRKILIDWSNFRRLLGGLCQCRFWGCLATLQPG